MNPITLILFVCLAVEVCGQSEKPTKPLTYEESRAANRPPTQEAAKAMGDYAAEATKHCEFQISFGKTDPQVIRDAVVFIIQPQEERLRDTLKAAGWTEKQVEITVSKFEETFLDLTSIGERLAKRK